MAGFHHSRPGPVRRAGAATAVVTAVAGLTALVYGLILRLHIADDSEALADRGRGGIAVLAAAVLLLTAAVSAVRSGVPWWPAVLIVMPIPMGVVPALLLPASVIPFATALLGSLFTIAGLIAVVVHAVTRRARSD